jgi:protein translocase SecG subunit
MITLQTLLPYIQAISGILLVVGVLLQRSEGALGAAFGDSSLGGVRHTRRGFEQTLFIATILFAVVFVGTALASLITSSY